jgi:RNA-directed DNA polymerase
MGRPEPKVKSFDISKRLVFEAWEKVRDNAGAPGVDAVSVSQFQERERDSLYKLWNRMSAGSYMPGPVRAVEITKGSWGRGPGSGSAQRGRPDRPDRSRQAAGGKA